MNTISIAWGWAQLHPVLVTLVAWPFFLGVFNFLFKPKTPEQYARIAAVSPRLAGLLQLLGTLGIDPTKAASIAFEKVLKGNFSPPPPPLGPSIKESVAMPRSSAMRRSTLRWMLATCGFLLLACSRPVTPLTLVTEVEAGAPIVNASCTFLEGVTSNQTVISICATVEEIALIASVVAPFLRIPGMVADAGCTSLPTTTVCLAPSELGLGIQIVLEQRRSRLLFDGGVR